MKKLSAFLLLAIVFVSCADNYHSKVKYDVMEGLEEIMAQLNDSDFKTIVINDAGKDIVSDISPDSAENIIVNMNIPKLNDVDREIPMFVAPVAVISVIGVFLCPVLIVFVICYFIYRSKKDRNRVVYESIVTGRALPVGFYKDRPKNMRFQSAVAWLAWSIGLFVFFAIIDSAEVAFLMLIPFIIGVGKLAAFFMYDYKKERSDVD